MASSLQPLVVVCGATGVGKSKLGVELALRLVNQGHNRWRGARIINADSMQVYTGLNVVTNKIPPAERMGIDHLLMNFKRPEEEYPVGQWVHDAMQAIKETHNRNEIPIVVGGTSYWIQHLLFPSGLASDDPPSLSGDQHSDRFRSPTQERFISKLPPDLLKLFDHLPEHVPSAINDPDGASLRDELLRALDEPVAARWHLRDTPKVLRALQIIKEQGRTPSEIINEKHTNHRYRTLCFCLHAEQSVLDRRLDERVDDMIKNGLVQEIRELYEHARTSFDLEPGCDEHENHFTVGLFQSIGYKEFYKFISDPDVSEGGFADAVEQTKHSTREYAKRQVAGLWNKLLPAIHRVAAECRGKSPVAALYLLDATVLGESWISNVYQPARTIMNAFLNEEELPDPTTLSPLAQTMLTSVTKALSPSVVLEARRKVVCPLCTKDPSQPVMVECAEWEAHQRTRLHRRLVTKAKGQRSGVPRKHGVSE
ncbi:tRNA isopentenyltransferase [Pisolithus croceorrhizus]|nr:tRNA isopentenyltransferase [Pisolithus croceorrhizus]KAI6119518.1 tRNA isopentenyltransferase [Pisolithus croceorrhizus]KAI6167207.1 tRNA isopentenyltransferase [Pisolithus thermaeus]